VEGNVVRRRRRIRRLALGGLCALVLPYGAANLVAPHGRLPDLSGTEYASRTDPELGRVVTKLAGRDAEVYCWSHEDWKDRAAELSRRWPDMDRLGAWRGYTWLWPVPSVHFSAEICIELLRIRYDPEPVWEDSSPDGLAWSVSGLAHESVHVSGVMSEAKADCYGMQRIRTAAVELGRSEKEGQYLAERYWKRFYRWSKPPYHSRECRNGGALDLRPGTDVWP
jgi:hypothetical protein